MRCHSVIMVSKVAHVFALTVEQINMILSEFGCIASTSSDQLTILILCQVSL